MVRLFKRSSAPSGGSSGGTEAPRRKTVDELKPDPDRIGISGSVPFVRLPDPDRLFATRAARLETLAPGHPLEGYLRFLSAVARGQAAVQAARAAPGGVAASGRDDDQALRMEHGMPPLSRRAIEADQDFQLCLDALLAQLAAADMPAASRAALDGLAAAPRAERADLAVQIFEGAIPLERMAECLFVSAALQIHLAGRAASLDARALKPVADGVCPCCGGAPTASLVVAWTPADKARYLSCSLCGTQWNHVRIRCTACGAGDGISYYGLDEVSKDVQVETCTSCNSYIKHLHQHRDPALDPIADDIASYGLDLKIAAEEFKRAGLNLLFLV